MCVCVCVYVFTLAMRLIQTFIIMAFLLEQEKDFQTNSPNQPSDYCARLKREKNESFMQNKQRLRQEGKTNLMPN